MNIFNVGSNGINLYLLDSGTHRLLVDSGFPGKLNDLGRAMRPSGFRVQDIDYLVVTHFHVDHAGAVQELKNSGVRFVLFDIQIHAIQAMERMVLGKWPYTPLMMLNQTVLKLEDSRSWLRNLDFRGQMIHTPGHSDDSISLLLDSGEAFTGDLRSEALIMEEKSEELYSWGLLKNHGAVKIFPSHGNSYDIQKFSYI